MCVCVCVCVCVYAQLLIVAVQLLSHVRLFVILWISTHQASPSFSISWSLFKLISIDSVMPSNHLIFCHRLLLPPSIFPSIRVFSNELALRIRRPNSLIPWFLSQDRPLAPPKNSTGDLGVQMQQKCGVGETWSSRKRPVWEEGFLSLFIKTRSLLLSKAKQQKPTPKTFFLYIHMREKMKSLFSRQERLRPSSPLFESYESWGLPWWSSG